MSTNTLSRRLLALVLSVGFMVGLLTLPTASSALAAGGAITGVASGKCLDITGGSEAPGTATIIWDCHSQVNQRWSLPASGDLRVFDDRQCLEAENGGVTAGTRALIVACTGGAEQQWSYTANRALVHKKSGLCLDVRGLKTAAGSEVRLWTCNGGTNQQWRVPTTTVDSTRPTPPTDLKSANLSCSSVDLSWGASTDASGVTGYEIYHDGQRVTGVGGTTLGVTVDVVAGVTWGWYINARDAAGNISLASNTLEITPPQCSSDTTAPTTPTNVTASASGTSVTVSWSAASDNVGVTRYDILRGGTRVGTVAGTVTTFTESGLAAQTSYSYSVVARDAQGNTSPPSASVGVTTGTACTSAICGVTTVATDTDIPWGLVNLPDGSILYSRRDAHDIVRLDPVTGVKTTVGAIPGVSSTDGEGGLMGLAVAPDFQADPWLYIMHTTASDNRIVRMRYTNGRIDTASTQVLVSGILQQKFHNGGRLRFGPDGMLYAATGDAQNGDYAQKLTGTGFLNGKILRLTRTGQVPSDNPFGSFIWSYGHRNPQGLAFDSRGQLWQQEFGNSNQDETNLVQRGGNYGWPQCEGTVSISGSGCGGTGLMAPKRTYRTADASCSGLTVVRDVVYIACGRGSRLYRLPIVGDTLPTAEQYFVGTYGRLRTVEPTPDGNLWLTTTNQGDKDSIANNSSEKIFKVLLAR